MSTLGIIAIAMSAFAIGCILSEYLSRCERKTFYRAMKALIEYLDEERRLTYALFTPNELRQVKSGVNNMATTQKFNELIDHLNRIGDHGHR